MPIILTTTYYNSVAALYFVCNTLRSCTETRVYPRARTRLSLPGDFPPAAAPFSIFPPRPPATGTSITGDRDDQTTGAVTASDLLSIPPTDIIDTHIGEHDA